jgi:hypothetical protein
MNRHVCGLLIAVLIILGGLATAYAAGVTEIKHCDPASMPPAQPTPQITAPGSYRLVRNLQATGNCLLVTADDVTINLNGFVISGNGSGVGVRRDTAATGTNLTVRNGTIRNFATGLAYEDNNLLQVEKVTFVGNVVAGINANNTVSVKSSAFINNGTGIFLSVSGAFSIFADNLITGNQIGLVAGCPSNYLGNTIVGNPNGNLILKPPVVGCNVEHTLAP